MLCYGYDLHANSCHQHSHVSLVVLLEGEVQIQSHHGGHQDAIDDLVKERVVVEHRVDQDKEEAVGQQGEGQQPVVMSHRFAGLWRQGKQ